MKHLITLKVFIRLMLWNVHETNVFLYSFAAYPGGDHSDNRLVFIIPCVIGGTQLFPHQGLLIVFFPNTGKCKVLHSKVSPRKENVYYA